MSSLLDQMLKYQRSRHQTLYFIAISSC